MIILENEVMYIKLDDIIPNRFQPREVFDEEALNKLAESIKQHGVIEPILVRPVDNKYEIVAGERRYKASVLAGLTKIPAMVRKIDDKESSIIAFVENEHRSNVSAIEEARTMERILKSNNITQEELAKELGINQSTIANKIRLLNLPLEVQEALMRNEISERHARSLLTVKDEEKQLELLKMIKDRKMTVRDLDNEIKGMNNMNNNDFSTNNVNKNDDTMFNEYLNNPQEKRAEDLPLATGFMDFLKSYDNSNIVSVENVKEETPSLNTKTTNSIDSVDNTFTPITSEEIKVPNYNDINNFNQTELPPSQSSEQEVLKSTEYNDFLNNVSTVEEPVNNNLNETNDPNFMEFLNNYDLNNPLPKEDANTLVNDNTPAVPKNDDYMSILNDNEENKSSLEKTFVSNDTLPSNNPSEENEYMNFLNDIKANPLPPIDSQPQESIVSGNEESNENKYEKPEIKSEPNEALFNENIYTNYQEPVNNVMINDVKPPITNNFSGQYIEDNPNYVDVSKQVVIESVDEIIDRLKAVVDDIKNTSKFKIDTDEINYDDIYQITIKIDKRDF